ncbi:hypothetical protein IT397_03095 [Candidatus Nomurabacteria bacterium]|nr:hypothetical protein [Candidatus Nomurabacteria bacterium]
MKSLEKLPIIGDLMGSLAGFERSLKALLRGFESTRDVADMVESPVHVPLPNQIRKICQWADMFGWPISEDDIRNLVKPKWLPLAPDRAIVLVVNLGPRDSWKICHDLWRIISSQHNKSEITRDIRGEPTVVFELGKVKVLDGAKKPTLYWEGINLSANVGEYPGWGVSRRQKLAGLSLMFLMAQAPEWGKMLGEKDYPFPWAGGIELFPGYLTMDHTFYFQHINKKMPEEAIMLGTGRADWQLDPKKWSMPTVLF